MEDALAVPFILSCQITVIIVYEIMNIWKSYMWSAEPEEFFEGRSSQLYTQLMQLWKESLKKIQTCTGFEPLTCCDTGAALSVRFIILSRVYNEAIQRLSPSWLVNLIGRALHRYRRGQGFESLNFFQVFFSQLHKLRIYLRSCFRWLLYMSLNPPKDNMLFF